MRQIIKVKRCPLSNTLPHLYTCSLCYGGKNCCPHISSCCRPIVVLKDYCHWSKLSNLIQKCKDNSEPIRLLTERPLPNEIIWAASYSALNIFQANINVLQNWNDIKWSISLVHKAERCGIQCLLVIYPILPILVKTYQVLQIIDAINSCQHCRVMIKFGEFINYGFPIQSGFIKLGGVSMPLSSVHSLKGDIWGCDDNYKSQFMKYLKFYADANNIDLRICKGMVI